MNRVGLMLLGLFAVVSSANAAIIATQTMNDGRILYTDDRCPAPIANDYPFKAIGSFNNGQQVITCYAVVNGGNQILLNGGDKVVTVNIGDLDGNRKPAPSAYDSIMSGINQALEYTRPPQKRSIDCVRYGLNGSHISCD